MRASIASPIAAAQAAARRYANHPTERNRVEAETKAIHAGLPLPTAPAPKPATPATGD